MSVAAWEFVFLMLVLKLPILYLIGVVWWAVRATPDPYEPAALVAAQLDPGPARPAPSCDWRARLRPRPAGRARPRAATAGARR